MKNWPILLLVLLFAIGVIYLNMKSGLPGP